ncbi:MAG: hypothetical protein WD066_18780 [Planctomycetaceae bacterium]
MVAAYHLIWTAYGWWLPNDPRGSNSREIRSASIEGMGELHRDRKRIQPTGKVIAEFYDAARGRLKHPLLTLTSDEVLSIAESFSATVRQRRYTCYACAILPDHLHLVIRKHRDKAEEMI